MCNKKSHLRIFIFRRCFSVNFISNLPFKKYIKAFIFSFVLSLVILAAISIVFSFFPPPEFLLEALGSYFYLFPVLTAAFLCGRVSLRRGLLTGLISAFFYILLLVMSGGILFKTVVSADKIISLLIPGLLCGAVGGILGINFK